MNMIERLKREQQVMTHESNILGYRVKIEEAKESIARLEKEIARQEQERDNHLKALGRVK